jgi:hypothetical protein
MPDSNTTNRHNQSAVGLARKGRYATLDIGCLARPDRSQFDPKGWGCALHRGPQPNAN